LRNLAKLRNYRYFTFYEISYLFYSLEKRRKCSSSDFYSDTNNNGSVQLFICHVPALVSLAVNTTIFIRDAPDTVFAGYPANPKAGYRISGKGRILDLTNYIFWSNFK
jgi:hypothetical protein